MTVLQIMAKHHMAHDKFSQLAAKLVKAAPPCMSSADDWEPTAAALEELSLTLEHGNPAAITPLPDAAGMSGLNRPPDACAVHDYTVRSSASPWSMAILLPSHPFQMLQVCLA